MYMTRNFPELIAHSTPELVIPPLTTSGGTSRTASAVLTADTGWRHLLNDATLSLHTHLSDMGDLARHFCALDSSLSSSLDNHRW